MSKLGYVEVNITTWVLLFAILYSLYSTTCVQTIIQTHFSIWANKRGEMILPYSIRSATSRRNIKNEIFEFLGQGFKDTNGACKQNMQPKIDYDMTILVDGSDSIKVSV